MRALLVVVVVVSGCGPTGYYVADIRPTAGGLEVTKCAFDDHGKAETGNCTTQTIATAPETIVPAPPDAPRRARPVPTAEQVKADLDGKSVHGLIEQCRATYAKDLTSFSFRVTIDPSHGVSNVEPSGSVDATFADCAAKALRAADVPRFDGPPVTYDEVLAL